MENQDQIVDEVRQLCEQYRQEVPGTRRAWPQAIKSRVRELHAQGVPLKSIAEKTGISYYTIHHWLPPAPQRSAPQAAFQPVKVVRALAAPTKRDVATVTVKTPDSARKPPLCRRSATVTVTLPGGIKIERATAEFVADLMQRLRRK